MWRHLLYLVCIIEAAALSAILVTMVVGPGLTGVVLSPRARQLCALAALVLMVGCAVGLVGWLRSVLTGRTGLNL